MKKQVFYIHGGEPFASHDAFMNYLRTKEMRDPHNAPEKRWHASLRTELGDEYEIFTPEMPNKQNAQYEEWQVWFERHLEFLHDDLIFVGWSLGGMFLMKYLSENDIDVSNFSLFVLAAPYGGELLEEESGKTTRDFMFAPEQLTTLQEKARSITIMHSKDDFVVPYEHALQYKEALPEAELVTFEDKNHFLVEELPELVELIRGL